MSDGDWTSIASPGATTSEQASGPQSPSGPPYPPKTAVVGGVPTIPVDDPLCIILGLLFLGAAAGHMGIFQRNKRRGFLFVFSALMFPFSVLRAIALFMRMAWAGQPTNVKIAIAANILTQAGTVIVFVINLFLAQRIVRAYHPNVGWSNGARILFRFLVLSVIVCLIMVIAATVQSFYTLDTSIRQRDRAVQLFAGTYLTILAFLPIPIVILAKWIPSRYHLEKFGAGSWAAKVFLIIFTSTLLVLGAGFRVGTNFDPRPTNDPAWYNTRAPFYVFNFVLDLIVAYTYMFASFHKRFVVPNGARGRGSYSYSMEKLTGPSFLMSGNGTPRSSRPVTALSTNRASEQIPLKSALKKPQQRLSNQTWSSAKTLRNDYPQEFGKFPTFHSRPNNHYSAPGFYPGLALPRPPIGLYTRVDARPSSSSYTRANLYTTPVRYSFSYQDSCEHIGSDCSRRHSCS